MSHYLSNSFQNQKKSSQLMKILKMSSSMTSSHGVGSGAMTLQNKMEAASKRNQIPHLMSATLKRKEKVNYRIQPKLKE